MRDETTDLLGCAQAYVRRGSYEDAFHTCQSILTSNSNCLLAHRISGLSAIELGRLDEAIEAFYTCTLMDPEDEVAHVGLALCAERLGDWEAAAAEMCRALELAPTDEWIVNEVVRRRGEIYQSPLMEARLAADGNPVRALMLLTDLDGNADLAVELTRARALWNLGRTEAVWDLCLGLNQQHPRCMRALLWLKLAGEAIDKPLYARMVARALDQIIAGIEASTRSLVGMATAQPA